MKIPIYNVYGQNLTISAPDICPHCNKNIAPMLCTYATNINNNLDNFYTCSQFELSTIFLCPNCQKSIFARYIMLKYNNSSTGQFCYQEDTKFVYPYAAPKIEIPQKIQDLYPDFYAVYEQAAKAENLGLDKICGMGFRKAVELLVKNYLIKQHNEPEEQTLEARLGQNINKIENPKIRALARSATWIGNDETHVIKKLKDYDVQDMKKFIHSLCYFIASELIADEAQILTQKK